MLDKKLEDDRKVVLEHLGDRIDHAFAGFNTEATRFKPRPGTLDNAIEVSLKREIVKPIEPKATAPSHSRIRSTSVHNLYDSLPIETTSAVSDSNIEIMGKV